MTRPLSFASFLLLTSALGSTAFAQTPPAAGSVPGAVEAPQADSTTEQVETSTPGGGLSEGDIVVVGRNIPNTIKTTSEVLSVLSTADIARTGEGDIAGALGRVTGLSVVGNGFVYVRGLGDRYSSSLLNGSPLPSPEPLRRVVPLDIFPTDVIASALVQKSYSVNYPGEFGGGVINLTTKAIPDKPFLSLGGSISGDTETTGKLGYTYYGGDLDWLGFDDGTRDVPKGLATAIKSGNTSFQGGGYTPAEVQAITAGLNNASTTLLQRNKNIPANFSANLSGGTAIDTSFGRLGVIAAAGYDNSWRTRDALQQLSLDPGLEGEAQRSFQNVITENHLLVNGLLGLGAEFGEHKIRWTNLYIRDSLKQGRLAAGYDRSVADQIAGEPASLLRQSTNFVERQLIDTQFTGEFKFDRLSVDLRGTYANSQRESPYERAFSYNYDASVNDYVNNLTSVGQSASVAFSDLEENLWSGGIDFSYRLDAGIPITLSAGYNYSDTNRTSSRYQFQYFLPNGALDKTVAQERPDYLLSDYNIYTYNIQLQDVSGAEGTAAYEAQLRINAGYGQIEAELTPGVRATVGVRYEDAKEVVNPVSVTGSLAGTSLANDYFLPAATVTWNFAENMQLRIAGSKTIARPQFRELAQQVYFDYESDRQFTGNPFLTDSKLYNAEARYEWYFGRDQRVSLAGFYKKIDNPIEASAFIAGGGQLRTGFANAPEAQLYGGEIELQKYVPLDTIGAAFFNTRRAVIIANYTYSKSKLKVGDEQIIGPDLTPVAANVLFRDGAPLTGQSDHLVNLQLGLEDTDSLSQQTVLFTYASKRVTNRGPIQGSASQPDIVEEPGIRLDFVARQGFELRGIAFEAKFEARNITGQGYKEFQQAGDNRVYINRYDIGRRFSLGLGLKL